MTSLSMASVSVDAEMDSPREARQLKGKPAPVFQFPDVRVQVQSPGHATKNPLNLTLPQHNIEFRFSSIETLVDGNNKLSSSPPRRIILSRPNSRQKASEAESDQDQIDAATTATTLDVTVAGKMMTMLKTPPLICEQGPSAPASPTSPSPGRTKRPCPLSVDALQRFDLLSPNYVPMDFGSSSGGHHHLPGSKGLPPISPSYPTSDLGSSPRSSISATHYSQLGIGAANWTAFRDEYNKKNSSDDTESELGCAKDFLSPHQLFSPAPFSPYSDCGIDMNNSASVTPYSYRSPNLSPSPIRSNNLHFSFDQMVRSRSSMSNRGSDNHHQKDAAKEALLPQQRSLDQDARERSRSEGEMLMMGSGKKRMKNDGGDDDDEEMDTSFGHSTYSVPAAASASSYQFTIGGHKSQAISGAGHKRRLLQRCRKEQALDEDEPGTPIAAVQNSTAGNNTRRLSSHTLGAGAGSLSICQQDSLGKSASQQVSRQPTIEEPPPSPTLVELFHAGDLDKDRRNQVEEWIRQQSAALEAFRQSLIPPQQESHYLQVPSALPPQLVPQNSLEQLVQLPLGLALAGRASPSSAGGPIRPATLWRRSRSESDVSASVNAAAAAAGATTTNSQLQQNPAVVALNDAIHVCEHCGQGFSMHDRLAKHIASRHRDRSASMNDENAKIHKCTLCPKSFGRSDMLTRHMRLHTGVKPYSCQICGQVFSRSDHLSTHQRTHTGEKPYRCPQCSYSASRRDMITRHMRTHLQPDGSPLPFTELQIPPINELSIGTPNSQSPQPQQHQPLQLSLPVQPHSPSPFNAATPPALSSNVPPSWPVPVPPPPATTNPGTSSPLLIPHSNTAVVSPQMEQQPAQNQNPSSAPFSQNGLGLRTPSLTTLTTTAVSSQPSSIAPQNFAGIFPPLQAQNPPPIPTNNGNSNNEMMVAATKLLTAIAANGNSLLNQQMMLSTLSRSLDGQIPTNLRRSTPNLLGTGEHPSAFRPLKLGMGFLGTGLVEHQQPQPNAGTNFGLGNFPQMNTTNIAAAAAAAQLRQLLQQTAITEQHRPPITASPQNIGALQPAATGAPSLTSCLTTTALNQSSQSGFPFLLRQNSIGGFGMDDAFGFSEGLNSAAAGGGEASNNTTITISPSLNK